MTVFALIIPSSLTFLTTRDFGPQTPPVLAAAKDRKWVTYTENITPFDSATEKATVPVVDVQLNGVTKTVGKEALAAQEIRDRRDNQDSDHLVSAVKDIALTTVGIAEALIAKGVLVPTDVEATTRQAYVRLKTIADRLRE